MSDVVVKLKLDPDSEQMVSALRSAAEEWDARLRRGRRYLWLNAALTSVWLTALICHWLLEFSL